MFKNRVKEETVARILELIATVPNRRDTPLVEDLKGPYEFWFDGGACTIVTGWCEYVFQDGTVAIVGTIPALSVTIKFVDGRRVRIQQESDAPTQHPWLSDLTAIVWSLRSGLDGRPRALTLSRRCESACGGLRPPAGQH